MEFGIDLSGCGQNSQDHFSALAIAFTVESQEFDELLRRTRPTLDAAVPSDDHGIARENFQRIGNGARPFREIARLTTVEQVVVAQTLFGILNDRSEMLDVKVAEPVSLLFAFQAIHAAEQKLVSEPFAIFCRRAIALRAVLSAVCLIRVTVRWHPVTV